MLQQLQSLFSCIILKEEKKRKGGSEKVLLKADIGILQQFFIWQIPRPSLAEH